MANRKKYMQKLAKAENLRKKNFIKKIKRKNIILGRKLNEKGKNKNQENNPLAAKLNEKS